VTRTLTVEVHATGPEIDRAAAAAAEALSGLDAKVSTGAFS
jgi:hypothetical protein